MRQLRLERVEQNEEPELIKMLNSDIILRIKFYVLLFVAIALFIIFCFAVQPQTYGFINW